MGLMAFARRRREPAGAAAAGGPGGRWFRPATWPDAGRDLVSRVIGFVSLVAMGVLLGFQYWTPNKRVIPVVVVLLVFGVAWRLSMAAAMNVLVFLLPYPKGTVFGSTNLAFILMVFVIWLLRLSLKMSPPARSSPIDLPIFALILWYILSFYNVLNDFALERAIQNFELFLGCVLMYYMIINSVRTQRDLQRFHVAQMITALGVFLIAAWEARHAGQALIPGLLDFSATGGHDFNTRDVRVGASFRDYELLSEYCGLFFLFSIFLWVRARSATQRALLTLFALFNVYTMFTTVTRGVFIALALVIPTILFTIRRHLNPVRFMTAAAMITVLALTMNFFVAKYTNSGDLFLRMSETRVVHGFVPEAREAPWTNAVQRSLVHPILGQGPYYGELPGHELWWPHNVYLYVANIVGYPGLLFFLMILFGLYVMLRPVVDDLRHPSYADAYLIIARAQLIMFCLNEIKIDFLRNGNYTFQVWLMFSTWTAAYLVSRDEGVRAGFHTATPLPSPVQREAA
jgi:O-antigen ligase